MSGRVGRVGGVARCRAARFMTAFMLPARKCDTETTTC